MLQIKAGLAIHANYYFDILDTNNVVQNSYTFLHSDLPDATLDAFSDATVFKQADFGSSGADLTSTQNGSLVPLIWSDMTQAGYSVNYIDNDATNQTTCQVTHTLWYTAFGLSPVGQVTLFEFGIRNLSRVVLIDEFQSLNGINIKYGDRLRVRVVFKYTYYTNASAQTLGVDTFGTSVDYTAETFVLPDAQTRVRKPFQGYGASGVIRIYPITQDIRKLTSDNIPIPTGDSDLPFQDYTKYVDGAENRCDVTVVGYRPLATKIFGFVLKDMIRQVGILVRFSAPVTLEANSRYQVGGFVRWAPNITDVTEGHVVVTLPTTLEQFPINMDAPTITITRPDYGRDVAMSVANLEGLSFALPDQTVSVPAGTTWAQVFASLSAQGLKGVLYSTRIPKQQSSIHTFEPFTTNLLPTLTQAIQEQVVGDQTAVQLPVGVIVDKYQESTTANQWIWTLIFPYMGSKQQFYGYSYVGYGRALTELTAMSQFDNPVISTLNITPLGQNATTTSQSYRASDYIASNYRVGTDRVLPLVTSIGQITPEQLSGRGFNLVYRNDFDGVDYQDWVSGTTTIEQKYQFCDLTNNIASDTTKNVTEFQFVVDTSFNVPQDYNLWVGEINVGNLSSQDLPTLNRVHNLYVTKQVIGTQEIYTFKRLFDLSKGLFADLYFVPTTNNAFSSRAIGALQITKGTQGYQGYDLAGGSVNSTLTSSTPILMAGVRLYQPLPENMFTSTLLSASQAALYYQDPSITQTLQPSLFNVVQKNYSMVVEYVATVDSLDERLNGNQVYPAMGFDVSKIDPLVDDSAVLLVDPSGKSWTKRQLLNYQTAVPHQFVGSVLYFVFPTKLTPGATTNTYTLASAYYGESFSLTLTLAITLSYTLATAQINPSPVSLVVGTTIPLTYTFLPSQSVISKVYWSSADPTIAVVDQNGVVGGVGFGTVLIYLLLNGLVQTSVSVTVGDPDIVISCVGAKNISTPLLPIGGTYDLRVNDTTVLSAAKPEDIRTYFRSGVNFRAINYTPLGAVSTSAVSETGFMQISGTFAYLYIGNTLVGRDLTSEQVIALLGGDDRIVSFK